MLMIKHFLFTCYIILYSYIYLEICNLNLPKSSEQKLTMKTHQQNFADYAQWLSQSPQLLKCWASFIFLQLKANFIEQNLNLNQLCNEHLPRKLKFHPHPSFPTA